MKTLIKIDTQSTEIPRKIGNIDNPSSETLLAFGYRWHDPDVIPAVADGFERLGGVVWADSGDGENAVATYTDTLIADRLAAESATEAARKATPIVYDRAVEAPLFSVLSQTAGKGIGITATDEGDIVTIIAHESPWPDKATLDAKIAAGIAKHRSNKETAKAGVSGQLQTRIENIERLLGLRE
jgi:hypothetical protein